MSIKSHVPMQTIRYYVPGLQDTGDLEVGVKVVNAVAEGGGLGAADYSAALTLPAPTGPRAIVAWITARLEVNVTAFTAAHLYCRVYVDAQDAAHRLFNLNLVGAVDQLAISETNATTLAAIFALLGDGAAHTFYFFFWVDALAASIDIVRLWEGVGAGTTFYRRVFYIYHSGFLNTSWDYAKVGTGAPAYYLMPLNVALSVVGHVRNPGISVYYLDVVPGALGFAAAGTVATDLWYLNNVTYVTGM